MKNLNIALSQQHQVDIADLTRVDLIDTQPNLYLVQDSGKTCLIDDNYVIKKVEIDFNPVISFVNNIDNHLFIVKKEGIVIDINNDNEILAEFNDELKKPLVNNDVRSPDLDVCVLLTCQDKVLLVSSEGDLLAETDALHSTRRSQPVNVGWGSQSTQFRGKEGKFRAGSMDNKSFSMVDEKDRDCYGLSWRDDGDMFALSLCEEDKIVMKIFDRSLNLLAEAETNLASLAVAFRPECVSASRLVAAVTKNNKGQLQIEFFERNGLRHGHFDLRLSERASVRQLSWNREGNALLVLASDHITLEDGEIDSNKECWVLQIWTCSNYHWSLKQRFVYENRVLIAHWDSDDNLKYRLVLPKGEFVTTTLNWTTDLNCESDNLFPATVGVVDGHECRVTPLGLMFVPPPMCAFTIALNEAIKQVVWPRAKDKSDKNFLMLHTDQNRIYIMDTEENEDEVIDEVIIENKGGQGFKSKLPTLPKCRRRHLVKEKLNNLLWLSSKKVFLAVGKKSNSLLVFDMSKEELELVQSIEMDDELFSLRSDRNGVRLAAQTIKGKVIILKWIEEGRKLSIESELDCKELFSQYFLINMEERALIEYEKYQGITENGDNFPISIENDEIESTLKWVIVGLSTTKRLYLNTKELCTQMSSLALHPFFVLATSSKEHHLLSLPISSLPEMLTDLAMADVMSTRRMERGAVLVASHEFWAAAQMPRGNLELVYPQALVRHKSRQYLRNKEYARTFAFLKRHRQDPSLIVDYDKNEFMANIEDFIEQMGQQKQNLALFIQDLKVPIMSDVCDAIKNALLERNEGDQPSLMALLMAFYKSEGAAAALRHLGKLRKKDAELAAEGLAYLVPLVDVNVLFNEALGLYDFDLVLFVAEKSQKDPQEYLPLLNSLRSLKPSCYCRFRIDKHLGRTKSALANFVDIDDGDKMCLEENYLDEIVEVVVHSKLFVHAINLFRDWDKLAKKLYGSYGHYLRSKRYFEDAYISFLEASLPKEALSVCKEGSLWRQALDTAQYKCNYSEIEIRNLALELREQLKLDNKYNEASQLLLEYCSDMDEEIVETLVLAQQWSKARALALRANRDDLILTHLAPGLVNQCKSCSESIANVRIEIESKVKRLQDFRQNKILSLNSKKTRNEDDLFSENESVKLNDDDCKAKKTNSASLVTRNTRRSSRSKKRDALKKFAAKAGSEHEDIGLIAQLHHDITHLFSLKFEVGQLTRGLLELDLKLHLARARNLQSEMDEALKFVEEEKKIVWNNSNEKFGLNNESGTRFGPNMSVDEIVASTQEQKENKSANNCTDWMLLDPWLRFAPVSDKRDEWRLQLLNQP